MRKLFILATLLFVSVLAYSISIYDIQYTTVAGPGSNYPSLHVGEIVNTEGIVSGTGFTGGKYSQVFEKVAKQFFFRGGEEGLQ